MTEDTVSRTDIAADNAPEVSARRDDPAQPGAVGTGAAVLGVIVGTGLVAACSSMHIGRSTSEAASQSSLSAGAAERRIEAAAKRGIGDVDRIRSISGTAGAASGREEEQFGEKRRRQLRENVNRLRKQLDLQSSAPYASEASAVSTASEVRDLLP